MKKIVGLDEYNCCVCVKGGKCQDCQDINKNAWEDYLRTDFL